MLSKNRCDTEPMVGASHYPNGSAKMQFVFAEHGQNLVEPNDEAAWFQHLSAFLKDFISINHWSAVVIGIFRAIRRIGQYKVERFCFEVPGKFVCITDNVCVSFGVKPDVFARRQGTGEKMQNSLRIGKQGVDSL